MPENPGDAEFRGAGGQARTFDREQFWRDFQPENLLQVLPREVLVVLLRGFMHRLRCGVALLYPVYDPALKKWVFQPQNRLDSFDRNAPGDSEFYSNVCWNYREKVGDKPCLQCDRDIAQEYADGKRAKPSSYDCWMGFTNLAFPLKLDGATKGVLLSGQILPENQEKLSRIRSHLTGVQGEPCAGLVSLLEAQLAKQSQAGDYDALLKGLSERLAEFGEMLQRIAGDLHATRKRAATDGVIRATEQFLGDIPLTRDNEWWLKCSELLAEFAELIQLEDLIVYRRNGAFFDLQWTMWSRESIPRRIPARRVTNEANEASIRLAQTIGVDPERTFFYHSGTKADGSNLAPLFVAVGALGEQHRDLILHFCAAVGARVERVGLLFQLQDTHARYVETVAEAAHDFRTPLQVLLFDTEYALDTAAVQKDEGLLGRLQQSKKRIQQAETRMTLLRPTGEAFEDVDLPDVLDEVIETFGPMAERHPCKLVRWGKWPVDLVVRAKRSELVRAFSNFIDNAIKYSFHGARYQVRVTVEAGEDIVVRISNFGVGIPSEKLSVIRTRGGRGGVIDRFNRPGWGLGLPIAERVLNEIGATYTIDSRPFRDNPPDEIEAGTGVGQPLRHVTTVEVRMSCPK